MAPGPERTQTRETAHVRNVDSQSRCSYVVEWAAAPEAPMIIPHQALPTNRASFIASFLLAPLFGPSHQDCWIYNAESHFTHFPRILG
jgi:hypothetical protein